MIRILSLSEMTPAERTALCARSGMGFEKLLPEVRAIVGAVREKGDAALREFTKKFDGVAVADLEVSRAEIDREEALVPKQAHVALRAARENIQRFHQRDVVKGFEQEALRGVLLGRLAVAYDTVGIYVPGGRAAYPSTVLMAAIPAALAGVKQLVLCTPPGKDGAVPSAVLAAAKMAGVHRVFRVGGAHAIAAMACGTTTIPACQMIVGPGNAYVTAAKQLVRDTTAVDFLAGPTEILVVSDGTAPAKFIAADLLAQAEHDEHVIALLLTTGRAEAEAVAQELEAQLPECARRDIAKKALAKNGAAVVCGTVAQAMALANDFAPEHLVLVTRHPKDLLRDVKNAGSIFLGEYSPVAVGDYCSGPNHILPTLGWAKFSAGLSTSTFVRHIAYQYLSRDGLDMLAPNAMALARLEGFDAHARSIEIRLKTPASKPQPAPEDV